MINAFLFHIDKFNLVHFYLHGYLVIYKVIFSPASCIVFQVTDFERCLSEVASDFPRNPKPLSSVAILIVKGKRNRSFRFSSGKFRLTPNMTETEQLSLHHLNLRHIDKELVVFFPKLRILSLRSNKLTKITATSWTKKSLKHLYKLDLSLNQINLIQPKSLRRLKKLKVLNLERNKISSLNAMAFYGLQALHVLNLENNLLIRIDLNSFCSLTALTTLSLRNNQILVIDSNNTSIISNQGITDAKLYNIQQCFKSRLKLDVSFNKLKSLGNLKNYRNITSINASFNEIERVSLSSLAAMHFLSRIDLSHNKIISIEGSDTKRNFVEVKNTQKKNKTINQSLQHATEVFKSLDIFLSYNNLTALNYLPPR